MKGYYYWKKNNSCMLLTYMYKYFVTVKYIKCKFTLINLLFSSLIIVST